MHSGWKTGHRRAWLGAGTAAVMATTLIAVPALAGGASAAASQHTLTFTATPTSYHYYNKAKTLGVEVDRDTSGGKVIDEKNLRAGERVLIGGLLSIA